MLLILLDSVVVHSVHVLHAAMLAQTRAPLPIRTESPQGPRILLLVNARTNGKTIVSVEIALERTGGRVMRVTERAEAEQLVRRWDPQVMVLLGWSSSMRDWLRHLQFASRQGELPFLVVGNSAGENHEETNAVAALETGAQAGSSSD